MTTQEIDNKIKEAREALEELERKQEQAIKDEVFPKQMKVEDHPTVRNLREDNTLLKGFLEEKTQEHDKLIRRILNVIGRENVIAVLGITECDCDPFFLEDYCQ